MQHRMTSRRGVRMLALAGLLGLTLVTLTQCRAVNDTITGVNPVRGTISARSDCHKKCDDAFKAAQKQEDLRHKNAMKACGSHDVNCKKGEDAKHRSVEDSLKRQREQCKGSCYNEGSGGGGK